MSSVKKPSKSRKAVKLISHSSPSKDRDYGDGWYDPAGKFWPLLEEDWGHQSAAERILRGEQCSSEAHEAVGTSYDDWKCQAYELMRRGWVRYVTSIKHGSCNFTTWKLNRNTVDIAWLAALKRGCKEIHIEECDTYGCRGQGTFKGDSGDETSQKLLNWYEGLGGLRRHRRHHRRR